MLPDTDYFALSYSLITHLSNAVRFTPQGSIASERDQCQWGVSCDIVTVCTHTSVRGHNEDCSHHSMQKGASSEACLLLHKSRLCDNVAVLVNRVKPDFGFILLTETTYCTEKMVLTVRHGVQA